MNEEKTDWFRAAKYGLFLHWGPYAEWGKGEQVLMRDHIRQSDYEKRACRWHPQDFDADELADWAVACGFRYAVLTTRHHDGYCLWDSRHTDYTSAQQAPRRDFVREYVEAFRSRGIRVGLYYSLMDWRVPAFWNGPSRDPRGWDTFCQYVHHQVEELLTHYGKIDLIWFDAAWPHGPAEWRSFQLEERIRQLQPGILINNRLYGQQNECKALFGDFGTPEREIVQSSDRPWEACHVTYWRLWGYAKGERVRPTDTVLDMLCETVSKGGNLLLNVGPDADGRIQPEIKTNLLQIGDWLRVNGEAIFQAEEGDVTEFVVTGWQTRNDDQLFLICRFWTGDEIRLPGLKTRIQSARMLDSSELLDVSHADDCVVISGFPPEIQTDLFPVIAVTLDGPIEFHPWAVDRFWSGDPSRYADWAAERGNTVRLKKPSPPDP